METKITRRGLLSGNALKLIAAAAMTADHVGVVFFPGVSALRIVGRLAFPIFAYMIAEGCKYTRNRLRYFLTVFLLAALCQTVYYFFDGSLYLSVLVTFSLSIPVIYGLQFFRERMSRPGWGLRCLSALMLGASVAAVWWLNRVLTVDYGFWGCMLPVFAALFSQRRGAAADVLTPLDKPWIHTLTMGVGLVILSRVLGGVQMYSLLSLPLLLCYSGRRGRLDLKYFFYIFYPTHLALLQGLWMLLN